MSKAKKIEDMLMSPSTPAEADNLIMAADAVVSMDNPPVKPMAQPTVTADINKLRDDAAKRGNVKLSLVEGTEVTRNTNEASHKSINDGNNDVVVLGASFFGKLKGAN